MPEIRKLFYGSNVNRTSWIIVAESRYTLQGCPEHASAVVVILDYSHNTIGAEYIGITFLLTK